METKSHQKTNAGAQVGSRGSELMRKQKRTRSVLEMFVSEGVSLWKSPLGNWTYVVSWSKTECPEGRPLHFLLTGAHGSLMSGKPPCWVWWTWKFMDPQVDSQHSPGSDGHVGWESVFASLQWRDWPSWCGWDCPAVSPGHSMTTTMSQLSLLTLFWALYLN